MLGDEVVTMQIEKIKETNVKNNLLSTLKNKDLIKIKPKFLKESVSERNSRKAIV